jgi:hypothetical protein
VQTLPNVIRAVRFFGGGGSLLVVLSDRRVAVWRVDGVLEIRPYTLTTRPVGPLVSSEDGRFLAYTAEIGFIGGAGTPIVVDLQTGVATQMGTALYDLVGGITSSGSTVYLPLTRTFYDRGTGQITPYKTASTQDLIQPEYSSVPSGRYLRVAADASTSAGYRTRSALYDLDAGRTVELPLDLQFYGLAYDIRDAANGVAVMCLCEGTSSPTPRTFVAIDLSSTSYAALAIPLNPLWPVVISPDGTYVAGTSADGTGVIQRVSRRVPAGTTTPASSGVPATASAVLVNVAMTDATGPGYITADKCTALTPGPQTKSNGNYVAGAAISNLSVVPVDADGRFCIYNLTPVHLVADVQGFFAPPAPGGQQFTQTAPARKLDTRDGGAAPVAGGSVTRVNAGVGSGASAVLVNVAMTDASAAGYITADKCSVLQAGPQTKSNGNYVAGAAISNLSVVPVDADGSFCIYNLTAVHLVVDIQGSFEVAGSQHFFPTTPTRILDTRAD